MKQNLGRNQRIRKKREFQLLFDKAKPVRGRLFALWVLNQSGPEGKTLPRCAVMVSKKVDSRAAVRNLWKRRTREAFRRNQSGWIPGTAVLFKVKTAGKPPLYREIELEMKTLLGKAGFVK